MNFNTFPSRGVNSNTIWNSFQTVNSKVETRDCTAKLSQLLSHFQSVIILSRFLVFKVPTLSYLLRKYRTRALKRRRQWGRRGVIFFYYCAQFSAKLLRDDIALQFFAKNLTQTGPFTVLYKRNQSQNGHSDGFDQSNEGTEGSMVRDHSSITSAKRWVGSKNGNFCWFTVLFMLT